VSSAAIEAEYLLIVPS